MLEGSTSTLEDIRAGRADEVAQSALRVGAELLGLLPTLATSPLQALARLHTLAGKGVVADADLGRPREPAGATRLRDLAALLTRPTAAPALLVAAVLIGQADTSVLKGRLRWTRS